MQANRLLALAAFSVAAVAAHAESPDLSGQFATQVNTTTSRAAVQADKFSGTKPWSIQYNPVADFHGQRTRAEVTGEYLASRGTVAAFTGEDSGAAYLAAHGGLPTHPQLAGQPRAAQ